MNNTWWDDSSKESNDSNELINNDQQLSNVSSENTHTHTDAPDSLITTKGSHFEENIVAKKQKNKKLAIILTSVLSVTALGVATFALIKSCSSQYNLKNENLLFTQRDIQNYKTKVEKNDWTKEEFEAEISSDSLTDFTKLNLLVENKTISNLIVDVLPLQPNMDDTQNIEVRLKTQKDNNGNELNNYYKLDINVDENLAELKNNNLVLKNIDVNFIRGVQILQLDKLYNEINNYISLPSYKFTKAEFKNHIVNDQNKDLLKNMIVSNLYVSEFQRLDINQIKSVDFDSDKLIIELSPEFKKGEYVKFLIQSNPNFYLEKNSENYILYINNLKFWTDVSISSFDLNNLSKKIQEFINLEMNQFNLDEFKTQLNTPMFKNAIAQYLNIYSDKIGTISYENDSLKISPSSYVKFTCSELNTYLKNEYIEISNKLNFYTTINVINLNILYNKLNDYIKDASRKLTAIEFLEEIRNNKQLIKNLIIDNLYVGTNNKIDSNKILDISLNDLEQLEITLDTQYIKYKVEANPNIVYRGNKLIVSNLGFYQKIIISEKLLTNLQNWIQNFINEENNKFTRDEFVDQLNTSLFKSKIAAYLQISVSDIKTINYTGQYLEITPQELKKFSSDDSNSTFIINDEIHVNNLRFYSETNLVNLSRLYTALNLYITDENRKYTVNELKNVLANSPTEIKTLISNNLNTASSGMIEENDIKQLSVNENNELIITLNGDYIKYTAKDDANVVVKNTTIIVKNLQFYTSIALSENNLELIHTHIQNYITDNNIPDSAESITDIEIFDLIKNIRTEDNKKLGDFINTPVRTSRVVEITLKPFVKLVERQTNNVEVQSDKIIIKNLILSTTAGYFEWEGTKIIGLTELGRRQTSIVVPSECTEIKNDVFFANKKIEHVDLSNTSITELKEDIFSGTFSGASNLKTIRFPKTLKKIAGYTFAGCNSLTNVEFPEGLTNIGPFAFADCHSLKTVTIPNLITNLPQNVFYRCSSLTTVKLPENLKNIDMEVFKECVNLESINIPDSIIKIVFSAFEGCHNPNLKLYCASEETRERVSNMTLTSIKKEQIVLKTN